MSRLTHIPPGTRIPIVDDSQIVQMDPGWSGPAIDRLARYEDVRDTVVADQQRVIRELEGLRNQGKGNTVRFRELMGQKLWNGHILLLYMKNGLDADAD